MTQSITTQADPLLFEAERRAEQLAGGLRMAVTLALMLTFLLAVQPRAEVADAVLQRQWLYAMADMAGYFLMGLGTWAIARSARYRRWMVWPIAAGDCFFVLGGLWASLGNTGAGSAATLAFPSAWLVPVVLAFGALRVDPRVLWAMTGTIVLGLAGLIWISRGAGPITEQEMAQMATFFAPPPNLMRLAMIGVAGAVLALAARRTRALLIRSIEEAQRRANLTRYLPAQLAPRLAAGGLEDLRRGKRQPAAILFTDLRGFTGLVQEMPPDAVSAFVSEFRRIVAGAAQQSGGIVDKFMGDAALVVFESDGDDRAAARACLACARALQTGYADWAARRSAQGLPPVEAGIGAHWGEVFSGVVGDDDRLEYSVFGDTVNIAARLEALTRTSGYGVVISRDLARLAEADTGWTALPVTEVRGRSGPLELLGQTPNRPVRFAGTAAPDAGSAR